MASAAERVYSLIEETVKNQGVELWDVRFLKEGANWYLRVFIDKSDGVGIDDCSAVSHAIDPVIDEADPIDRSYYLEVCSCGVERELVRPWHYEWAKGKRVKIKLYKALDGKKEFSGILTDVGESLTLNTDDKALSFPKESISKAYLDDFND